MCLLIGKFSVTGPVWNSPCRQAELYAEELEHAQSLSVVTVDYTDN